MKAYLKVFKPKEIFVVIMGCSIYGVSANFFIIPNHIAPGGATGLSVIINYLTNISVGAMIVLLNLPLFFLSKKMLGKLFFIKTFITTLLFSFFVDFFAFLPSYTEDKLLAAVFGGILGGFGLGLVFTQGVMTGGSDLFARLLKRKFPSFSLGQLILVIDVFVIALAALTFKNLTSALYAIVAIFTSTKVIDIVLTGLDRSKTVLLISDKAREISLEIIGKLGRTATFLDMVGAYSNSEGKALLCVVRRYELYKLKQIVKESDEKAFFIVFDANEVYGLGFKDKITE